MCRRYVQPFTALNGIWRPSRDLPVRRSTSRDFDREAEAVGMLIKLNERRKAGQDVFLIRASSVGRGLTGRHGG